MKTVQKLSLTQDSIENLFLKIAIPSSVGTIFQTLYNLVDTYFAGKISPESLAAIKSTLPSLFKSEITTEPTIAPDIFFGNPSKALPSVFIP